MDIRATYTIAMAVAIYYICYIPIIGLSIWRRRNEEQSETSNPWLPFIIFLFSFVSGALNPVIYILRNRRNRSALRQLVKDPCGTSAYQENPVRKENKAKQQEMKPPKPQKEDVKDCRDPEAGPDPGSEPRRPTSAKIQIHQSHSVVKRAWKKNEESANEQVAVAEESRRGDEKAQDEEGESSGSLRDKDEECNRVKATTVRAGTYPGSDPRQPTSIKIQIHQSHIVAKMAWKKNEKGSGSQSADEQAAVAGESRWADEKTQDVEAECFGSVRDKNKKMKAAGRKGIGTFARVNVRPNSI